MNKSVLNQSLRLFQHAQIESTKITGMNRQTHNVLFVFSYWCTVSSLSTLTYRTINDKYILQFAFKSLTSLIICFAGRPYNLCWYTTKLNLCQHFRQIFILVLGHQRHRRLLSPLSIHPNDSKPPCLWIPDTRYKKPHEGSNFECFEEICHH